MPDPSALRLSSYGPTAVVIGAGAGLGAAFCRALAAAGLDLVMVDRDEDAVRGLADELSHASTTVIADLADPAAPDTVLAATATDDVGLLVANAAVSHIGRFVGQTPAQVANQIQVNVAATTALVHAFARRFSSGNRDRSAIIVMSSQSSRRGAPLVSTYAATKAYLAVLAESLWFELRDDGVDVLGVLPGSTRTPGWLASHPQSGAGTSNVMQPEDVVAEALAALGGGAPTIVPGEENRVAEEFLESMSRAEAVEMVGEVMRATYPPDRTADPDV